MDDFPLKKVKERGKQRRKEKGGSQKKRREKERKGERKGIIHFHFILIWIMEGD